MKLHDYQKSCLKALEEFFGNAAKHRTGPAFAIATSHPYIPVPSLREDMPYVCVRVPTGGGKTFLAAHALRLAAEKFCYTDVPFCLWLAPSEAIVSQTAKVLGDRGHPYRQALDIAFPEVKVFSAPEALMGNFDLHGAANILVCTIQTLRRENTEDRKIYDDNGNLMAHFENLPEEMREGMLNEDGTFNMSLANVLSMHSPIVIMDEAHNARTNTSFKSLGRFNPSCVLEFTATPQLRKTKDNMPSNVLCQVSARELQLAEMIKLPIMMESFAHWRQTMARAIAKRAELEGVAAQDGRGIRPITLYQAESSGRGEAQVDAVKTALLEENIPEEQIAVAIGGNNEIQGIDVLAKDCPIRHIITKQALAEGWDCPYAYVLCGLANITSPTAVEQILGRVLRMPFAKASEHDALNCAYAFVSSANFRIAAHNLREALISGAGFQKLEAGDFFYHGGKAESGPLFGRNIPRSPTITGGVRIPMLAAKDESGTWRFVEEEDFLDSNWDIAQEDANLPGFTLFDDGGGATEICEENGRIKLVNVQQFTKEMRAQMSFAGVMTPATKTELVSWLDRTIKHPDITQPQSFAFICNVVDTLLEGRNGEFLQDLARHRFYLRRAIEKRIAAHRREARRQGVAGILQGVLPDGSAIGVNPDIEVTIQERHYAPNWTEDIYMEKHLFPRVGELKASGEEFNCAAHLDGMEEVEFWIRNLDSKPVTSFWLPTAGDRFYPDFVAKLKDGRWLVVEYKGEHLWVGAQHDRDIGSLWANCDPDGRVFVMVQGPNYHMIKAAL